MCRPGVWVGEVLAGVTHWIPTIIGRQWADDCSSFLQAYFGSRMLCDPSPLSLAGTGDPRAHTHPLKNEINVPIQRVHDSCAIHSRLRLTSERGNDCSAPAALQDHTRRQQAEASSGWETHSYTKEGCCPEHKPQPSTTIQLK